MKQRRVCQQNLSKNCIFYGHIDRVCSFLFAIRNEHHTELAVRAVPSGLPVTAIFMSFYTNDRAELAQGEKIMTYTNDLPSNLLLMETFSRLQQLGCAVTAGQTATGIRERNPRAKDAGKRTRQGGTRAFSLVYGKAASV